MSPDEVQNAFREVDQLVAEGYFLRAVAVLRRVMKSEATPRDELHRTHLKLAEVYRAFDLPREACREVLAVASHWNDEGRTAEARTLLVGADDLVVDGVAALGDVPADPAAARDAIDGLIRRIAATLADPAPVEDEPEEEVTPAPRRAPVRSRGSASGAGDLPAVPGSRPTVPVPVPAARMDGDEADRRDNPLDALIDELGARLLKDPSDVRLRLKLGDLLVKAGRGADGIAQLVLAGQQYEKSGEPHLAVKVYKGVLKLAPDRRELHNRLGDIYTHLGLLAEAATEYEKAER